MRRSLKRSSWVKELREDNGEVGKGSRRNESTPSRSHIKLESRSLWSLRSDRRIRIDHSQLYRIDSPICIPRSQRSSRFETGISRRPRPTRLITRWTRYVRSRHSGSSQRETSRMLDVCSFAFVRSTQKFSEDAVGSCRGQVWQERDDSDGKGHTKTLGLS